MKSFIIIALFLVFIIQSFAQDINSGVWNSDCNYHNYIDNVVVKPLGNNLMDSLLVDLNADGILDIRITAYGSETSQWGMKSGVSMEGINQCQIAFLREDTCFSDDIIPEFVFTKYIGKELGYNELIDSALLWTDTTVALNYGDYSIFSNYNCSYYSQIGNDTGYVAARIIESTDTLYAWIKISNVGALSCVIYSYACTNKTSSIKNVNKESSISIYPNPTNGNISIVNNNANKIKAIRIYDCVGKLQFDKSASESELSIDLSHLSNGMYFVNIESMDEKITIEKLIIKKE